MRITTLLPVIVFTALTACGTSGTDTQTTTETAATTTTTNTATTETTHEPSPCADVSTTATLSGIVVDTMGNPVEGAAVNLCHDSCRVANTGADGTYIFDNVQTCAQAIDVPNAGDEYATPITIIDFDESEVRDVTITLVEHGGFIDTPTTAAEVEIATGLFITVGIDDLSLLFGAVDQLAGANVDQQHYMPVDLPGDVLAMYHLEPFDAEAEPRLPVRIANTFGLKDGETVEMWTASYVHFAWLNNGTLTANGDWLEGDAALEVLSTSVIIKPTAK